MKWVFAGIAGVAGWLFNYAAYGNKIAAAGMFFMVGGFVLLVGHALDKIERGDWNP